MNNFFELMVMFTMMEVVLPLISGSPKPNPDCRNANSHYEIIDHENNCPNCV